MRIHLLREYLWYDYLFPIIICIILHYLFDKYIEMLLHFLHVNLCFFRLFPILLDIRIMIKNLYKNLRMKILNYVNDYGHNYYINHNYILNNENSPSDYLSHNHNSIFHILLINQNCAGYNANDVYRNLYYYETFSLYDYYDI
jgi:hypothetical protein